MSRKITVRSPGRINLIGEHTDYNQGFVLPAAIDKYLEFTIEPSNNTWIDIEALDLNESAKININKPKKSEKLWVNYFAGIIDQLIVSGRTITPFTCSFGGNIPLGAGLSSSAALSCGFLMSINELFSLGLSKLEIATLAQKSENDFVGVNCGIMDQYACVFGQKNSLVKIDCRSLEHEIVNVDFEDYTLLLIDTGVKHRLAETEYNMRRVECEQGVAVLQKKNKKIKSLRDVTLADLEGVKSSLSEVIFDRCQYVICENDRVLAAVEALANKNLTLLGSLMSASHNGLRDKFKVSCLELDILADFANSYPGVLGARMMGGGFGGCTINLIKSSSVSTFKIEVADHYLTSTGLKAVFYDIKLSDGALVV